MSTFSRQAGSKPLKARPFRKKLSPSKKGQVVLRKIPFKKLVLLSIVVGSATIALILILQDTLPPQVPLFYGLPKSQQQLTTSLGLVFPSIASLGIILINLFIAQILEDNFLQQVLIISGIVGVFFSTITTLKIIFLVGSL